MWTIDEALEFIREHQSKCVELGYHIALAGGVLNKGYSNNDLDLILICIDDEPFTTIVDYFKSIFNNYGILATTPIGYHIRFNNDIDITLIVRTRIM